MSEKTQVLNYIERIITQLEAIPVNPKSVGIRLRNCKGVTIRRCYIEAGIPIDVVRTEDFLAVDNELVSSTSIPQAIVLFKQLYSEVGQSSPSQTKIGRIIQKLKEIIPKAMYQIVIQTLIWLGHTYLSQYIGPSSSKTS